jgi:hypothetical protein
LKSLLYDISRWLIDLTLRQETLDFLFNYKKWN